MDTYAEERWMNMKLMIVLCWVASTPASIHGASFGASSPADYAGRPCLGSQRGDRVKKERYRLLSSTDAV
jgi:hypothetical protein